MPVVQFGTYKMKGEVRFMAVMSALRVEYMTLDTASVYDNEKDVGRAVLESVVDRKNLFIQTELWRSFVGPAKNGKPKFYSELRKSFKRLGVYD
jgi:diketogulonate reductase-like aldo/keto reductase